MVSEIPLGVTEQDLSRHLIRGAQRKKQLRWGTHSGMWGAPSLASQRSSPVYLPV